MDVPQGNRVEPELIEQLEIGMSKNQVEFLLGTPAVVDLYRPDIWHYILFYKSGEDGTILQRRMTLTFSNDLLSNIEGSLNPL
jgi:outer membrane protein assembly factor BamE